MDKIPEKYIEKSNEYINYYNHHLNKLIEDLITRMNDWKCQRTCSEDGKYVSISRNTLGRGVHMSKTSRTALEDALIDFGFCLRQKGYMVRYDTGVDIEHIYTTY